MWESVGWGRTEAGGQGSTGAGPEDGRGRGPVSEGGGPRGAAARARGRGEGARVLTSGPPPWPWSRGRPGSGPGSLSSAARGPAAGPARAAAPAPAPARAPAPAPAPPPLPASACWRGPSPPRGRPARPGLAASLAARAYAPASGEGPRALRSRRRARGARLLSAGRGLAAARAAARRPPRFAAAPGWPGCGPREVPGGARPAGWGGVGWGARARTCEEGAGPRPPSRGAGLPRSPGPARRCHGNAWSAAPPRFCDVTVSPPDVTTGRWRGAGRDREGWRGEGPRCGGLGSGSQGRREPVWSRTGRWAARRARGARGRPPTQALLRVGRSSRLPGSPQSYWGVRALNNGTAVSGVLMRQRGAE